MTVVFLEYPADTRYYVYDMRKSGILSAAFTISSVSMPGTGKAKKTDPENHLQCKTMHLIFDGIYMYHVKMETKKKKTYTSARTCMLFSTEFFIRLFTRSL